MSFETLTTFYAYKLNDKRFVFVINDFWANIQVAVFDLMPKAKRWFGIRPILVWESFGHGLA